MSFVLHVWGDKIWGCWVHLWLHIKISKWNEMKLNFEFWWSYKEHENVLSVHVSAALSCLYQKKTMPANVHETSVQAYVVVLHITVTKDGLLNRPMGPLPWSLFMSTVHPLRITHLSCSIQRKMWFWNIFVWVKPLRAHLKTHGIITHAMWPQVENI